MKLLLDECMPRRLKKAFAPHEAFTVEDAGFKGLKNGRLLREASSNYDVLITVDQNIPANKTSPLKYRGYYPCEEQPL